MSALRGLLTDVVDYAGLFPPAALDMPTAIRNYVAYRRDPASWMLGRFVVPVGRLAELDAALSGFAGRAQVPIKLSGILGAEVEKDIVSTRSFQFSAERRAIVDVLEARFSTEGAISHAAAAAVGEFELFAELPVNPDPGSLVEAVARAGIAAKIRTGGVTPDAFPAAEHVVRFIRRCLEAGVRFKATAGLHHPVSAEHALTYEASSPRAVMYGYLNLFLAAAFMNEGMTDAEAVRVLQEDAASAFVVTRSSIAWRGQSLPTERLIALRQQLVSFGSCSFREPVDELRELTPLA